MVVKVARFTTKKNGKRLAINVSETAKIIGEEDNQMVDLIDRQAAIDALGEEPEVWVEDDYAIGLRNQWRYDVAALKDVPSAQPVITCDGCRFVGTYDTDFPCCSCVRREKDYYEPER